MNILVSVNKAFFEASKIMLRSLFIHNQWEKINVYLFHNELENIQIKELRNLAEYYHNAFIDSKIHDEALEGVPVAALSKETYYRLFAPNILPKDIDKILYLDVDLLITGSLKELYQIDLQGYYFAGAPDMSIGVDVCKRQLEIPEEYTYINAGVLLMNLKELRKKMDLKAALDFARKYPRKVPNCDQDVINGLYYDKIRIVGQKFNYEARFHSLEDLLLYPFRYIKFLLFRDINIIHYMGKSKPWLYDYNGKFGILYYKMAKSAHLHNIIFHNIKYSLRNSVKYLLDTGFF